MTLIRGRKVGRFARALKQRFIFSFDLLGEYSFKIRIPKNVFGNMSF